MEMARFPHAQLRGAGDQVAALKARHVLPQEGHDLLHLPAAHQGGPRQVFRIGAGHIGAVGHVAGDHAGRAAAIQKHMARRKGQAALAKVLNGPLGRVQIVLEAAGEHGPVRVHAGHLEHQANGLHPAVLFPAHVVGNARAGGDVPISRGVDDHLGQGGAPARLALQKHARQAVLLQDGFACKAIQQQAHPGLFEQLQQAGLEGFGVDDLPPAPIRPPQLGRRLQELLVEASLGVSGPMAHQARGGHAAHVPALLHQQHGHPFPCGADGRGYPRRSGAQHQHVRLVGDGDLPRRFCHASRHAKPSFPPLSAAKTASPDSEARPPRHCSARRGRPGAGRLAARCPWPRQGPPRGADPRR